MESRQLLVDYIPFEVTPQQINESLKKNNGRLIVNGVLQRAGSKNQNGRIYPREVLIREAKKYAGTQIKERRALGELDHPDSSVVNLQNASHNILEMHWDSSDLMGTVEVLGTPSGNILKELFKAGIKLGISSRGLGSVKEISEGDGDDIETVEVQPDFELIAFDFVSNPSTQGAFMRPMNESVNSTKRTCGKWCKVESIINDIMQGA
ncbi:primosomal protein [Candidatus Pacearchaeota archaeon]|nr:primosomal protein [Candidatus Pacearchaeota archaeon]|tara:strand:- start:836 stop:1459 length:624 start_codon:yes stop_codon:yes gene_type:complete